MTLLKEKADTAAQFDLTRQWYLSVSVEDAVGQPESGVDWFARYHLNRSVVVQSQPGSVRRLQQLQAGGLLHDPAQGVHVLEQQHGIVIAVIHEFHRH
jgi:hypothetical protein